MGLIKDIYSVSFYQEFANEVTKVYPNFNKTLFIDTILNSGIYEKEWKERMQLTTVILHDFLPPKYSDSIEIILKIIEHLDTQTNQAHRLVYLFFADFVSRYGLDDFKTSVRALEKITQFISCEFAIRPFIIEFKDEMIEVMISWSTHKNHHVRRLASEGSRPRLPWGIAIQYLKLDPSTILPILENLKNDSSEYVRRSVANNLNDIAKDNPDIVVSIARKWLGENPQTDAIVKHGCRTLLKLAHSEILPLFNLDSSKIHLSNFKINTPTVSIGETLKFEFTISNTDSKVKTIRLEYAIYYKKSKGHLAKKIFKISEKSYNAGQQQKVIRNQSFKIITTRVFHPGLHELSIITNGKEHSSLSFELVK